MNVIQNIFSNERVIWHAFQIAWPEKSLNPCDFLLWGFLKDCVYQGCVTNEVDFKANIVRHVSLFPLMCQCDR